MAITFSEFILEANIAGSRPRPRGKDVLTPSERSRVSTRSDRSAIQKTGGGTTFYSVAPETPEKPNSVIKSKPKNYIQKWLPGFPPPKDLKVKKQSTIKLPKPSKPEKTPKQRTRQLSLKLKEFIELYRQSIANS